jgi:hypothetical protein
MKMTTPLAYAIDMLTLDVYVNRSSLADQSDESQLNRTIGVD